MSNMFYNLTIFINILLFLVWIKYIYKHFDKIEDITFNWPLCLVTSKENPS